MSSRTFAPLLFACLATLALASGPIDALVKAESSTIFKVTKSESEWKRGLPADAFTILRKAGTERPYTGKYWDIHEKGLFECAGCGLTLFSSDAKFDSGTGWPSFFKEIARGRTLVRIDRSEGEVRSEIICSRCGGHLGHVFDDGPKPTGLRYCMNSPALKFVKAK